MSMNVGMTTQTWSESNQKTSLKSDDREIMSAQDKEKLLQGKDVGTFLNELTDPNYIDPAKLQERTGSDKLGRDAFFKMMLAQIKNQDPTTPLKSHEMAAQLAQFSSLEQLMNINEGIEALKASNGADKNYQVVNLIGKTVKADTARIIRAEGDSVHELRFSLPKKASNGTVEIQDAVGQVIRKLSLSGLKEGENKVNWNGKGENGVEVKPGEYRVKISASDAGGKNVAVNTQFDGKITGVNFTATGPVVLIGDQKVRLKDISRIEDVQMKKLESKTEDLIRGSDQKETLAAQLKKKAEEGVKQKTEQPVIKAESKLGAPSESK